MNEIVLMHSMLDAFDSEQKIVFSKKDGTIIMTFNDVRVVGRTITECLSKYAEMLAIIQLGSTNK